MCLASCKLHGYQTSGQRATLRGIQVGLTPGDTFRILLGETVQKQDPWDQSLHPACRRDLGTPAYHLGWEWPHLLCGLPLLSSDPWRASKVTPAKVCPIMFAASWGCAGTGTQ